MAQRVEFRFGKNSSFECELKQLAKPLDLSDPNPWVLVNSSTGGQRLINTARCTQIIIGLPDKDDVPTARG